MRASVIDHTGPASRISWREVTDPTAGPDTLVVRVEAAAVDHVDTIIRRGSWATELVFPQAIGHDAVGVVVDAGGTAFRVGERVWTNSAGYDRRAGASAELLAIPADRAYPVPEGADAVAFCALLHSGATAHALLGRLALQSGESVAITGANGVVGAHLVFSAARSGARVIAVVRREGASVHLRELGASSVVVADGDEALGAAAAAAPEGLSAVVEASGHTDFTGAAAKLVQRGHILVIAGQRPIVFDLPTAYQKELRLEGFVMSAMTVDELAAVAPGIIGDWQAGLRIPTMTLPLAALREAHEILEGGGPPRGKDGIVPRIVLSSAVDRRNGYSASCPST